MTMPFGPAAFSRASNARARFTTGGSAQQAILFALAFAWALACEARAAAIDVIFAMTLSYVSQVTGTPCSQ